MSQEITQRELRNNSGEIMRELDEGNSFMTTRNGTAVAKLIPLRRNTLYLHAVLLPHSATHQRLTSRNSATTSTSSSTRMSNRVPDKSKNQQPSRGLLDMSVVIDLGHIDGALLPQEMAISSVTLAELSAGLHATQGSAERARRQERLQRLTHCRSTHVQRKRTGGCKQRSPHKGASLVYGLPIY